MNKVTLLAILLLLPIRAQAQETARERVLALNEYLELATKNDTEFQTILIDELPLQYRKDLNLPARDIVLEATTQYDLFLLPVKN